MGHLKPFNWMFLGHYITYNWFSNCNNIRRPRKNLRGRRFLESPNNTLIVAMMHDNDSSDELKCHKIPAVPTLVQALYPVRPRGCHVQLAVRLTDGRFKRRKTVCHRYSAPLVDKLNFEYDWHLLRGILEFENMLHFHGKYFLSWVFIFRFDVYLKAGN